MSGYADTKKLIEDTLVGRPAGTLIYPEQHQAFALSMLDYIRSVELVSGGAVPIGFADASTVPVQPDNGQAVYLSSVSGENSITFSSFRDENGNPITVSSVANVTKLITLLWNGVYWSVQTTEVSISEVSGNIPYSNPVLDVFFADPCFWKGDDGYFYLKRSGIGTNSYVYRTRDFVSYENTNRTFLTAAARQKIIDMYGHPATDDPTFIVVPDLNAPNVVKIGQKWVLYMNVEEMSGTSGGDRTVIPNGAHIVAFVSKIPYGDFDNPICLVSDGELYANSSTTVTWDNVIDPFVYCDTQDNKVYLIAGSSQRIRRARLTDDGLALEQGTIAKHVAGLTVDSDPTREKVFEGAYLYSRVFNGQTYFYLFVSSGSWQNRDYCIKVGRRAGFSSIGGPDNQVTGLLDKEGRSMRNGYGTTVIESNPESENIWGPGHVGGIFETADGKTWILYHCHTDNGVGYDRKLFLQELKWDEDGWPYVEDENGNVGYPCLSSVVSTNVITKNNEISFPVNFSKWYGKTIAWYGTSVPRGYPKDSDNRREFYAYPDVIAKRMGAKILNYCVNSGVMRRYRLDGSELQRNASLSFTNTGANKGINYQDNMLDLIGTENEPDLFVFDYGINDLNETSQAEFTPPIDYTSRSLNSFIGSFGFVLEKLFTAKPRARVIILTHFSDDGCLAVQYGKGVYKALNDAIVGLANYWGVKIIEARHLTGWINTRVNQADTSVETITTYCSDKIHPASGTNGLQSVKLLADLYQPIIEGYE